MEILVLIGIFLICIALFPAEMQALHEHDEFLLNKPPGCIHVWECKTMVCGTVNAQWEIRQYTCKRCGEKRLLKTYVGGEKNDKNR